MQPTEAMHADPNYVWRAEWLWHNYLAPEPESPPKRPGLIKRLRELLTAHR